MNVIKEKLEKVIKRGGGYVKIFILIILIILIFLLSGTYAYWKYENIQENENYSKALCMDVSIINEEDDILLEKAYPMSDEEGSHLTPYKFTVKNNCETKARYFISFELTNKTTLSDKYLAISLNGQKLGILNELERTEPIIENILNEESAYSLGNGFLEGNEEKNYELRIWLDKDADEDSMNKYLEGKVTILADYLPELNVSTTLVTWGRTDNIKIHGFSKYHNITEYSVSEKEEEYNWVKIDAKKDINIVKEVNKNGKYYVSIKDSEGGITTQEITVDKIDDVLPTMSDVSKNIESWTSGSVRLTINGASDNIALHSEAYSFDGGNNWQSNNYKDYDANISNIVIKIRDSVGNIYEYPNRQSITNIDNTRPTIIWSDNTKSYSVNYSSSLTIATANFGASGGKLECYSDLNEIASGNTLTKFMGPGYYHVTCTAIGNNGYTTEEHKNFTISSVKFYATDFAKGGICRAQGTTLVMPYSGSCTLILSQHLDTLPMYAFDFLIEVKGKGNYTASSSTDLVLDGNYEGTYSTLTEVHIKGHGRYGGSRELWLYLNGSEFTIKEVIVTLYNW